MESLWYERNDKKNEDDVLIKAHYVNNVYENYKLDNFM